MNDIQSLEAACIAAPDDDSPRLILADKLAESGCLLGEAIARNRMLFTLCRWASQLNRFEWPADFLNPKPEGYDNLPDRRPHTPLPANDKFTLQHEITGALRTLIGEETRLIYHNQIHLGEMDDAAFEDFWHRYYGQYVPNSERTA